MRNEEDLAQLPKSWTWAKLSEICVVCDRDHRTPEYLKKGIPLVSPQCFTVNGVDFSRAKYVGSEELNKFERKCAPALGDIMYSRIGTIGEARIIDFEEKFVALHSIALIKPNRNVVTPKFILYSLATSRMKNEALRNVKSVGTPDLGLERIGRFLVPLAPLNEQVRIVAKLEELFTRLDAGVEGLRKVKVQLKRYRQAVLKYAFEGKLTEEWRKTHKDTEPATKLLEKTKQERKEKLGTKYKELPPTDASELPTLPESWMWIRLGEISERMQYGTSEKASTEPSGILVLRMGNIQEGRIVFDDLKYFHENWPQLNEFLLSDGDVLFNRTNSAELVGKTAVYREHHPKAVFASYLIRVQTDRAVYISEILSFFINSFYGRKYISSVASQQVGQANVNGTKLSLMPIPLMPGLEQIAIQQEMERCFSIADEMEEATEQSLRQAVLLRQSISKVAFEGKLVPQDSSDEPAEKLLERIREERAKSNGEEDTNRKNESQLELSTYVK